MSNNDPNNPFNWRLRTGPSIFLQDPYFRARSDGLTDSQRVSQLVESKKIDGKSPPVVPGLSKNEKKTKDLLAYKQFGTYSKAMPSTKRPNKHEK